MAPGAPVMFTSQFTPNVSCSAPRLSPHGAFERGIPTSAPYSMCGETSEPMSIKPAGVSSCACMMRSSSSGPDEPPSSVKVLIVSSPL